MPQAKNFAELKKHILDATTSNITQINIQNDMEITEVLVRPPSLKAKGKTLTINGNGRTLKAAPGIPYIFGGDPPDQTTALNTWQSQRFIFEDISFEGNGAGVGIGWGCSYGTSIGNCTFKGFEWGVDLKFALMTEIDNLLLNNCGVRLRHGDWTGASTTNSQSNHSSLRNVRVFCRNSQVAAFSFIAASGCLMDGCIIEGGQPQYGVYVDGQNSTVVKDFTIRRTHIETTCTTAAIKLSLREGIAQVDGAFSQYPQTLIDADTTAGYPYIVVSNIPWLPGGTKFKTEQIGSPRWVFDGRIVNYDPTLVTNWDGGVKPNFLQIGL